MKISEFFRTQEGAKVPQDATPVESEWFHVGDHELETDSMAVSVAKEAPIEESGDDGGIVELESGTYGFYLQGVAYGPDKRVARARVLREGAEVDGREEIGEAWTDLAEVGFYEPDLMREAMDNDEDEYEDWMESFYDMGDFDLHDVRPHPSDERIKVFVFRSGWGDGTFPVYALKEGNKVVGMEVEFIKSGEEYPFHGD